MDVKSTAEMQRPTKKILEFIKAFQISTLTQKPKKDGGCKVFIRYLNKNSSPKWIRNKLSSQGLETSCLFVRSVNAVRNRPTGEAYHEFAVHLHTPNNSKEIYSVDKLGNQKIIIEPQRPQLPQFQRCQKFGHSKNQCSSPYVCVKCAGKHPTNDWKKSMNEDPKCANCSGAHAASYRGCSAYQAALSKYKKIAQLSPPANAQSHTRSDPDSDDEDKQDGANSRIRTPSDANRVSIKKLTDTIQILQNNLLEVKNSISARQCYEQKCENCRPSTSHSRRHSCCSALTTPKHLSTLSSTEDYFSWRHLGRIVRVIQNTIDEVKRAERSSKLAFSTPISEHNSQLQLLIRDFIPLLVKLNIACDKDCCDNTYL